MAASHRGVVWVRLELSAPALSHHAILAHFPHLVCSHLQQSLSAVKHGIDVGAGVIDSDYRGLLGVLLFNFGEQDFEIKQGDRIAQLVLERIETPEVAVVEVR